MAGSSPTTYVRISHVCVVLVSLYRSKIYNVIYIYRILRTCVMYFTLSVLPCTVGGGWCRSIAWSHRLRRPVVTRRSQRPCASILSISISRRRHLFGYHHRATVYIYIYIFDVHDCMSRSAVLYISPSRLSLSSFLSRCCILRRTNQSMRDMHLDIESVLWDVFTMCGSCSIFF